MTKFLLVLVLAATFLLGAADAESDPFLCNSPINVELVKVTDPGDVALMLANGCSGRIGRIELQPDLDGIKIQNGANPARDLVIESGYIHCIGAGSGIHQDGIQALAGLRVTFRNLEITGCRTSQVMLKKGGSGKGTPTDVVCENCYLGPNAAHTAIIGTSVRTGLRNTVACPDTTRRNGAIEIAGTAQQPVNVGNTQPASCP